MARTEKKVGASIPNGDDNLVAGIERGERFVEESSKAKVTDANMAGGGDHDIGWLQVSMDDPILMEVEQTIQELKQD